MKSRLGEDQRAHVPEVTAGPLRFLAVGGRSSTPSLPAHRLLPLVAKHVVGLAPTSSRNLTKPSTKSGSPQSAKVLP